MAAPNLSQPNQERRRPEGNMSLTRRRARREASLSLREKAPEAEEVKAVDDKTVVAAGVRQARVSPESRRIDDFSRMISNAVVTGNTIRAAELRVQRAQLSLMAADSPEVRARAQATFDNAKKALETALRDVEKDKKKTESKRGNSRSEAVRRVEAKKAAAASEPEPFDDPH